MKRQILAALLEAFKKQEKPKPDYGLGFLFALNS